MVCVVCLYMCIHNSATAVPLAWKVACVFIDACKTQSNNVQVVWCDTPACNLFIQKLHTFVQWIWLVADLRISLQHTRRPRAVDRAWWVCSHICKHNPSIIVQCTLCVGIIFISAYQQPCSFLQWTWFDVCAFVITQFDASGTGW